jgi:hypothetical protein
MTAGEASDPGINWLLDSGDPSVRYLTLTEVLTNPPESKEASTARRQIPKGPMVRSLLAGQLKDGGFGVHPYSKWIGAHWRLVSLVELGIPRGFPPAVKATRGVLDWLTGEGHLKGIPTINGLTRRCASQEGNALAVCSRLGMAEDPRVAEIAHSLAEWQWPDGGWNCDRHEDAHHSSFNESLSTLWGLVEYSRATNDKYARSAVDKAAEFFLKHQLFRSCRTGEVRPPETFHSTVFRVVHPWTQLHYPLYWHYDILEALMILSRAGRIRDPRCKDALDLIQEKRGPDGLWQAEAFYWSLKKTEKPKHRVSNVDIVDWGRRGPNRMVTLNALRVLKAAGRLD